MKTLLPIRNSAALLAGLAMLCHQVSAETFVVDPAQSSITLSGNVVNNPIQEQSAGSLTSMFEGTLQLTVGASTVSFPGSSQLLVRTNGSWEPAPGGLAGSAPADFGAKASNPFLGSAKAALRNLQLDITSSDVQLSGDSFAAGGLVFKFITVQPPAPPSAFDYVVTSIIGNFTNTYTLTGLATNQIVTQATLATVGGDKVLTIPLDIRYQLTLLNPNDSLLVIKGAIVAKSSSGPGLVIGGISAGTPGQVSLTWVSDPNQHFQVLGTTNLQNWGVAAPDVTSTTTNYSWSTPTTGGSGFFQLGKP